MSELEGAEARVKRDWIGYATDRLASLVDIKSIIIVVFALHLFAMPNPKDGFVFDEAYYVPAALDLLARRPSNPEHPFMGKLWGALGIWIFGNNWFGWRIFYVILGTVSIYIFYLLCLKYLGKREALYAAGLLAFENMFFVHGNLALLEIPSIIFAFLGFYLYKIGRLYWSALAFGLSLLNKETGGFFIIGFLLYHLVIGIKAPRAEGFKKFVLKTSIIILIIAIVFSIPVTIYDQIYKPQASTRVVESVEVIYFKDVNGSVTSTSTKTIRETVGAPMNNAIEHVLFTLNYASSLTISEICVDTNLPNTQVEIQSAAYGFTTTVATDGEGRFCVNKPFSLNLVSGSYTWRKGDSSGIFYIPSSIDRGNFAWSWILPTRTPFTPTPYYVLNVNKTTTTTLDGKVVVKSEVLHPIAWYGTGNLPLWWSIWFLLPPIVESIIKRRANDLDLLLATWIFANYGSMLYLTFAVGRIVYPFYFLNTVPALALGFPYLIRMYFQSNRLRRLILIAFMIISLAIFASYYPVRIFEQ